MFNKTKPVLVSLLSLLFLTTSSVSAQEETIIVKGYGYGRTRYALVDVNGNVPANPLFHADRLNFYLRNSFGSGKTVSCPVDLQGTIDYVPEGTLVDSQGNLLADVFWAPALNIPLSVEEADELAKFVTNGGILYVGGAGWLVPMQGMGPEINLLFERLDLEDHFDAGHLTAEGLRQSHTPEESIITRGPFGDVGPLLHGAYRKFNSNYLTPIVPTDESGFIVHEAKISKGYLVVVGDTLYGNTPMQDADNQNYYLNLFALGCDKSWQDNSVVLDVPSFKQGLVPYDDSNPVWESEIYDDALSTLPNCGQTMADCACALTSATMVMKYFGVDLAPDASTITPEIINNFFKVNSVGFSGPNFRWSHVGNFSAEANNSLIGGSQPKLEQPVRLDYDLEDIKALVDGGKPVILKVNGGSHWVVVKGYDPGNDRLIINDPLYPDAPAGEYTYLDEKYTPDNTGSMIIYDTANSDYRYLEFATSSQNHLLFTDILGNKTGYDPETGEIVKQIPNSDYALDEYYGPPTTEGIYFLTLKLPTDGKYKLQILSQDGQPHKVDVYSSDTEGKLARKVIRPESAGNNYELNYVEESAGEEIDVSIDAQIDVVPFVSSNIVIPHKWIPAPVAILASDVFDVTKIDKTSLTFGKTGDEASLISCSAKLIDVNRDKKKDLVCYFYGDKTMLDIPDTQAILRGKYGDISFEATDSVKVLKPWFLF